MREAIAERRAVAVDRLNYKAVGKPFWNALFLGPIFGKDILTKPYRRSELAERARAALAKQRPGQPPATPDLCHEG